MPPVDEHDRTRREEHEAFLERGSAGARVRSLVADSWVRSAAAGIDPDANVTPVVIERSDLAEHRAAHPLSRVFPLLYDVLGRAAEDCDYVMAVGDAEGRLLWVCGAPNVLRQAESINFVEGSAWDEAHAGTNAPGTALHLDAPVQIQSAEHFNRLVHPWNCTAAPIHDPATHDVIGLVDVTGGADVVSPQTLGMVRAAARMAESELARLSVVHGGSPLWTSLGTTPGHVLQLHGLGRPDCLAELNGRTHRLSRRHSEILVALVDQADGLTAEQLELEVYPADVHGSTIRAEVARLRGLLGAGVLESRPYRLTVEVEADWLAVAAHLSAGRVGDALRAYAGPLLPPSEAPGVGTRRDSLAQQLRAAILHRGQPDLMVAWTRSRWGADDLQMWRRQAQVLPPGSPLRPIAAAEADRLESDLRR